MMLLYVASFILVILAYVSAGNPAPPDPVVSQSHAIMAQMSLWHKTSITKCTAVACADGVVDPSSDLPQAVKNGSSVTSARFQSRYNSASRVMVTYIDGSSLHEGGPTFGTIVAAIPDLLSDQTVETGGFKKSNNSVIPAYVTGLPGVLTAVPASIGAGISDGAPVMATRM